MLKSKLSFRDIKARVQSLVAKQRREEEPESLSLVRRLEATVKRAKKVELQLETGQKKKRLEKLLREIEALLDEQP